MHRQIINQIQRVLSDTARVGNSVKVCKTEEKVKRNRESRLSGNLVASCLEVSFVEDMPSRVY